MQKTKNKVARACDSCRIRKVKCDHAQPSCSQCVHFNLPCEVSSAPSRRKNPVRGRLVAQARGNGDLGARKTPASDVSAGSSTAKPMTDGTMVAGSSTSSHPNERFSLFESPSAFTGYSKDFFTQLVPRFEQFVYPVNPIIPPDDINLAIANMHNGFEDAALIYAFASVTIFLTLEPTFESGIVRAQMDDLMQRSLEAHKRTDLHLGSNGRMIEQPHITIKRVMTCIFLEISMMAFKRFDRSFALLREAITMIQTVKVHQLAPDNPDAAKYQRLYWEAFIHERFLTIASGHPSILPPLKSDTPQHDPSVPAHIQLGFNRLISLFLVMDGPFLAYWHESQDPGKTAPDMTLEWVERKQIQLDEDEAAAFEADSQLRESGRGALTEFQLADLFISRLWIRTLLWQLALSCGLLRSTPPENVHEGLSLQFPAQRISTQLRNLVGRIENIASISTQGSGIVQKLFEITSTIADVLALPRDQEHCYRPDSSAQVKDLFFLVRFLFRFEWIRDHQKTYLREKLVILQQLYPAVENSDLA